MKTLLLLVLVIGLAQGQRSFYASRYSKVLPRFRTEDQATTITTTEADTETDGVDTRNQTETSTTAVPFEGDGIFIYPELYRRISQWPEHKKPFWFKNWKAIWQMRNQDSDSRRYPDEGRKTPPFFGSSRSSPRTHDAIKYPVNRDDSAMKEDVQ